MPFDTLVRPPASVTVQMIVPVYCAVPGGLPVSVVLLDVGDVMVMPEPPDENDHA